MRLKADPQLRAHIGQAGHEVLKTGLCRYTCSAALESAVRISMNENANQSYDSYWAHRGASEIATDTGSFCHGLVRALRCSMPAVGMVFLGERLMKEKGCTVTGMDVSSVALALPAARTGSCSGSLDQPLVFADNSLITRSRLNPLSTSHRVKRHERTLSRRSARGHYFDSNTDMEIPLATTDGSFPKQWLVHPWEHPFLDDPRFSDDGHRLACVITKIRAGSGRRWLRDWWPSLFAEQVCYFIERNENTRRRISLCARAVLCHLRHWPSRRDQLLCRVYGRPREGR